MKKFICALLSTLLPLIATAQVDGWLLVGDDTYNSQYNNCVPLDGLHTDAFVRSQVVYPASLLSELPIGANITHMTFSFSQMSDFYGAQFAIEMGSAPTGALPENAFLMGSNMTLVYAGELYSSGYVYLQFTTPFVYRGGPILLEVRQTQAGTAPVSTSTYNAPRFKGIAASSPNCISAYAASETDYALGNYSNFQTFSFIPYTDFDYTSGTPFCAPVSNLTADSIYEFGATLHWTGSASGYRVQIVQDNLPTAMIDTIVTGQSFSISNAIPETTYSATVSAICAPGDTAIGITHRFLTPEIPVRIYNTESYDFSTYPTGVFEQDGWTNEYVFGVNRRRFEIGYSTEGNTSSSHVLCMPNMQRAESQLTLPQVVVGEQQVANFWLTMERVEHHPNYHPNWTNFDYSNEGVRVFIDGVEQGWISHIYSSADAVHGIPAETAAGYYTYEFLLLPGRHTVMLQGETQYYKQISISEMGVRYQGASNICLPPSHAAIINPIDTAVTLSWQPGGFETQWAVRWRLGNSAYQEDTVSTTPQLLIGGLHQASDYVIEVDIKALCDSASASTALHTQMVFETECTPGRHNVDYLTLIGVEESTVRINSWNENAPDIRYSLDEGATWHRLKTTAVVLHQGAAMLLCGNNPRGFSNSSAYTTIVLTGKVAALGSVMSLLCDTADIFVIPNDGCFKRLFAYNSSGTSGGLIYAPKLPATTITNDCYDNMFQWCGIEVGPDLPAVRVESVSYMSMFAYCSNLCQLEVNFTDWGINTTTGWISSARSRGHFVKPAALRETYGLDRIPTGWTVHNTTDDYVWINVAAPEGSVRVVGDGKRFEGDIVTLRVFPKPGHTFVGWADGCTDNSRTFVLGASDTTFHVLVKGAQVNVSADETDSLMGHVEGTGTYASGDTVSLTAVANEGYKFVGWTDGDTLLTKTFVVWGDTALTALFEYDSFTLTAEAEIAERGSVSGSGIYAKGTTATLKATAANGYVFEQWTDGVKDNPREVVVMQDTVLTAVFGKKEFIVSISCNTDQGSTDAPETALYGDTLVVTVTPNAGYVFKMWADGSTDNPRTFIIKKNLYATALFDALNGLEDTPAKDVRKVMIDGQLYIMRGQRIYDIFGREIKQ